MQAENKQLTSENCKDSGLALVLILLLCYQAWKLPILVLLAIALLLVAMTYPPLFTPWARFWFGLSRVLGSVVSRIVLGALFFLLVSPVGLARRLLGKDSMRIKAWKQGRGSVFVTTERRFAPEDLEHPY